MCMSVLPTCVSGYHVRAYIPQRPEEDIGSCVTITGWIWATFWVLGIQPRFSLRKTFLSPGRFLRSFRSSIPGIWGKRPNILFCHTIYKVNKLCFIIFKFFWCVQFCCILKEKTIHCIACIWLVEIPENNFRETFNCCPLVLTISCSFTEKLHFLYSNSDSSTRLYKY